MQPRVLLDSWTRTLVVCAWLRDVGRQAADAAPFSADKHLASWQADRTLTAVGKAMLPMVEVA